MHKKQHCTLRPRNPASALCGPQVNANRYQNFNFCFQITTPSQIRKTWNAKYTLRSHFDGIRALSFHPTEPVLITASEDQVRHLLILAQNDLCRPKRHGICNCPFVILKLQARYKLFNTVLRYRISSLNLNWKKFIRRARQIPTLPQTELLSAKPGIFVRFIKTEGQLKKLKAHFGQ